MLLLAAQRALVEDKPTTLSKALDFLVRDFDVKFLWCEPLSQAVTTTPQLSPSGGSDAWMLADYHPLGIRSSERSSHVNRIVEMGN